MLITGIGSEGREGCLSAERVQEAWLRFDEIEADARERFDAIMADVIAHRKEAGIAGSEGEVA